MPPLPFPSHPFSSYYSSRSPALALKWSPQAMASIAVGTSEAPDSAPGMRLQQPAAAVMEVKGCDCAANAAVLRRRQRRISIDVFRRPEGAAASEKLKSAQGARVVEDLVTGAVVSG